MQVKPKNSRWTDEQWEAIATRGTNVLVSAGAGSGKTAVLSERALLLVQEGVKIDELIILTFTNAAAAEMKERIRRKLIEAGESDKLAAESSLLIDQSFITTFDSYCLYLVKKYSYLLNINKNISIIDNVTASILKQQIIESIVNKQITINDDVYNLLETYSLTSIDQITSKLLMWYENDTQNMSNFELVASEETFATYEQMVLAELEQVKQLIEQINNLASETNLPEKINDKCKFLLTAKSYDDISATIKEAIVARGWIIPRGEFDNKELVGALNKQLKDQLKKLAANTQHQKSDVIAITNATNEVKITINNILTKFNQKYNAYKHEHGLYDFIDINLLAIELLKTNKQIRNEIKNQTYEIMVDEYQDTNDIQELFISLISNDNVYMVGDIKQSIYGFRNANPKLFNSKFANYADGKGGKLITLTKNFRSRSEVLMQVNNLFGQIMSLEHGAVNYDQAQIMIAGNKSYDIIKNRTNEIISYNSEQLPYGNANYEIVQLFKDIKHKIDSNYQVVDNGTTRCVRLSDFAILCQSRTEFEDIVKIGQYYGISVNADITEMFSTNPDIHVTSAIFNIANIIKQNNDHATKFAFSIVVLARSFLFDYSDQQIDDAITNMQKIKDDEINKKLYSLEMSELCSLATLIKCVTLDIEYKSASELLSLFLQQFKVINKLYRLSNPHGAQLRISKLTTLLEDYDNRNYSLTKICQILNQIEKDDDLDIEFNETNDIETDSVIATTIHKSKGLEYNICYFPFLYKKFNVQDIDNKFSYDKKYRYILPGKLQNGNLTNLIEKQIVKKQLIDEMISEKLRLLYVALTRAKDKNILIIDRKNLDNGKYHKLHLATSFNDLIFNGYNHLSAKEINGYELTDEEDTNLKFNTFTKKDPLPNFPSEQIDYQKLDIAGSEIKRMRASMSIEKLIDKKTFNNIALGNDIHEKLEYVNLFAIDDEIARAYGKYELALVNLKKTKLLDNMVNYYSEFQFKVSGDIELNGIIDLLVEHEDKFVIIDYKLNDINKPHYVEQVMSYVNYIKTQTDKRVEGYLLSLINGSVKKVY